MYKIAFIDDEKLIVDGLKNLIDWNKYNVEIIGTASNGEDGYNLIKEQQPDIVISDIKMPKLTGLEMIEKLNDRQICFIILSGFDDFELVKKGIKLGVENYLLKPINEQELISTIEQIIIKINKMRQSKIIQNQGISVMRRNVLYRLIFGNITASEFEEKSALLRIPQENNSFSCVIIHSKITIINKIIKILNKIEKNKEMWFDYCDNFNDKFLYIIFSCQKENHSLIRRKAIVQLYTTLNIIEQSEVKIALGDVVQYSNTLVKSRETSERILRYQILYSDFGLLDCQQIEGIFEEDFIVEEIDIDKLCNSIESCDKNKIDLEIDSIIKTLKKYKNPDLIHNKVIYIMSQIDHWAYHRNIYEFFLGDNGTEVIQTLTSSYSFNEIEKLLLDGIFRLVNILEKKDPGLNPVIKRMLQFISEHLSDDITLKNISDEFNMNSTYIGSVFKKEVGISLKNYVNKLRIQKACDLLIKTNLHASEIGYQVGFVDPNYFSRVFKREVQCSPSEYRRAH